MQCNSSVHAWIKHLPACTVFMQVKCDCCDWWYHLQCINKKIIENYSMEDVERLEFKGPCCSANGQFNFTEQFNLV